MEILGTLEITSDDKQVIEKLVDLALKVGGLNNLDAGNYIVAMFTHIKPMVKEETSAEEPKTDATT